MNRHILRMVQRSQNMFFSKEQIEQSTKRLDGLNPFFGITFLALKKAELPIGTMKRMDFLQIVDEFLRLYYHPRPKHQGFYTPFKTSSKSKHWNTTLYKNTLRQIAIDNFSDVLSSSDENRNWGWKSDYVDKLEKKHLKSRIPAFDLAVWLFRSRQWEDKVQGIDIVEALLSDFHITSEERSLFDISIPSLADQWLQP